MYHGIGDVDRGGLASNNPRQTVRRGVDLLSLPKDNSGNLQHWLQPSGCASQRAALQLSQSTCHHTPPLMCHWVFSDEACVPHRSRWGCQSSDLTFGWVPMRVMGGVRIAEAVVVSVGSSRSACDRGFQDGPCFATTDLGRDCNVHYDEADVLRWIDGVAVECE